MLLMMTDPGTAPEVQSDMPVQTESTTGILAGGGLAGHRAQYRDYYDAAGRRSEPGCRQHRTNRRSHSRRTNRSTVGHGHPTSQAADKPRAALWQGRPIFPISIFQYYGDASG